VFDQVGSAALIVLFVERTRSHHQQQSNAPILGSLALQVVAEAVLTRAACDARIARQRWRSCRRSCRRSGSHRGERGAGARARPCRCGSAAQGKSERQDHRAACHAKREVEHANQSHNWEPTASTLLDGAGVPRSRAAPAPLDRRARPRARAPSGSPARRRGCEGSGTAVSGHRNVSRKAR